MILCMTPLGFLFALAKDTSNTSCGLANLLDQFFYPFTAHNQVVRIRSVLALAVLLVLLMVLIGVLQAELEKC